MGRTTQGPRRGGRDGAALQRLLLVLLAIAGLAQAGSSGPTRLEAGATRWGERLARGEEALYTLVVPAGDMQQPQPQPQQQGGAGLRPLTQYEVRVCYLAVQPYHYQLAWAGSPAGRAAAGAGDGARRRVGRALLDTEKLMFWTNASGTGTADGNLPLLVAVSASFAGVVAPRAGPADVARVTTAEYNIVLEELIPLVPVPVSLRGLGACMLALLPAAWCGAGVFARHLHPDSKAPAATAKVA